MSGSGTPPSDGGSGGPPFDPEDPKVKRWLVELNVALDDAEAIFEDAMRPLRKRELGHIKHREHHAEAWSKIMSLLGRTIPEDEPEGGPDMH